MGPLTYTALALQLAFWATDYAARRLGYRQGETVSAAWWHLERRWPMLRALPPLLLGYLAGHLALGWPL